MVTPVNDDVALRFFHDHYWEPAVSRLLGCPCMRAYNKGTFHGTMSEDGRSYVTTLRHDCNKEPCVTRGDFYAVLKLFGDVTVACSMGLTMTLKAPAKLPVGFTYPCLMPDDAPEKDRFLQVEREFSNGVSLHAFLHDGQWRLWLAPGNDGQLLAPLASAARSAGLKMLALGTYGMASFHPFDFDAEIPDALYWRPALKLCAAENPDTWKRVTRVLHKGVGYELEFDGLTNWNSVGVFNYTFGAGGVQLTRLPMFGCTLACLMPDDCPDKAAFLKLEKLLQCPNAFDVRLTQDNEWLGRLVRYDAAVTIQQLFECDLDIAFAAGSSQQEIKWRTPPVRSFHPFDFDAEIPDALYWRPALKLFAAEDPDFWKRVMGVRHLDRGYELFHDGAGDWKHLGIFHLTTRGIVGSVVLSRLPAMGCTLACLMPDGPAKSAFLKLEELLQCRSAFDVRLEDAKGWVGMPVRYKGMISGKFIMQSNLDFTYSTWSDKFEFRLCATPAPPAVAAVPPVAHLLAKAFVLLRGKSANVVRRYARFACGNGPIDTGATIADDDALTPLLKCRDPAALQRFIAFAEAFGDPKLLDANDDQDVTDVVLLHARIYALYDDVLHSGNFIRYALFGGAFTYTVADVPKLREALSFLREAKRLASSK
jgi:hypothetical protein